MTIVLLLNELSQQQISVSGNLTLTRFYDDQRVLKLLISQLFLRSLESRQKFKPRNSDEFLFFKFNKTGPSPPLLLTKKKGE